jgi:hypothetical protein
VCGGNAFGKGGKGDIEELQHRQRSRVRERNDLLRQAAGAWKSGNRKTRGGEVAAYFAERAREVQEVARKEQLESARLIVESKRFFLFLLFGAATESDLAAHRMAPQNRDVVDLHGTSVAEATVIVKEILQQDGCSPCTSLRPSFRCPLIVLSIFV